MSSPQILFYIFATLCCFGAVAVAVSQNVVRMAFWLMVSLGSVSGLFFLLRADFVAATQLMIYVGGTVVLLVFGVMLTASGRHTKIATSPAEGFLAAGIGALFLAMIVSTVASVDWAATSQKVSPGYSVDESEAGEGNSTRPIGFALLGVRPDKDMDRKKSAGEKAADQKGEKDQKETDKKVAGKQRRLSTGYLLPFEIVSVHLLVVLIGAAYLARAKRRVESSADGVKSDSVKPEGVKDV